MHISPFPTQLMSPYRSLIKNGSLLLLFLLSFLFLSIDVSGSSGDRADGFQRCVSHCSRTVCTLGSSTPSLWSRLMHWSCVDECEYTCMHSITQFALQKNARIHQYHGKWPFWRVAGMQEPASVLFSLLNLWGHVRGARTIRRVLRVDHPMRWYYLLWAGVCMNSWVWSAVFHTRDLPFTEKMDYFSAAASILFALYASAIRLFHLYPTNPSSRPLTGSTSFTKSRIDNIRNLWTALCLITFITHVSYLSLLPRFDYTYNIIFNLVIGMTHNVLWLIYASPWPLPRMRLSSSGNDSNTTGTGQPALPHAKRATTVVLLTTAATGLELFDFPPVWRTVDAHSLWHLATALILPLWYRFLVDDSLDLLAAQRGGGGSPGHGGSYY